MTYTLLKNDVELVTITINGVVSHTVIQSTDAEEIIDAATRIIEFAHAIQNEEIYYHEDL